MAIAEVKGSARTFITRFIPTAMIAAVVLAVGGLYVGLSDQPAEAKNWNKLCEIKRNQGDVTTYIRIPASTFCQNFYDDQDGYFVLFWATDKDVTELNTQVEAIRFGEFGPCTVHHPEANVTRVKEQDEGEGDLPCQIDIENED